MARVDFYRLTRDPVARVLPAICERVLAGGDRLVVVAENQALRSAISDALWAAGGASFLAHGAEDGELAAHEPIMLAGSLNPGPSTNGARMAALADGVWRDDALSYHRAFLFFDNSRIDDARAAWRMLATREGIERHFWKQDERGRWAEGP